MIQAAGDQGPLKRRQVTGYWSKTKGFFWLGGKNGGGYLLSGAMGRGEAVLATGGSIRRVNRSDMTMKMSLVLDGDDL